MSLFLRDVRLLAANEVGPVERASPSRGCDVCGCALLVGLRGRCIDHAPPRGRIVTGPRRPGVARRTA